MARVSLQRGLLILMASEWIILPRKKYLYPRYFILNNPVPRVDGTYPPAGDTISTPWFSYTSSRWILSWLVAALIQNCIDWSPPASWVVTRQQRLFFSLSLYIGQYSKVRWGRGLSGRFFVILLRPPQTPCPLFTAIVTELQTSGTRRRNPSRVSSAQSGCPDTITTTLQPCRRWYMRVK